MLVGVQRSPRRVKLRLVDIGGIRIRPTGVGYICPLQYDTNPDPISEPFLMISTRSHILAKIKPNTQYYRLYNYNIDTCSGPGGAISLDGQLHLYLFPIRAAYIEADLWKLSYARADKPARTTCRANSTRLILGSLNTKPRQDIALVPTYITTNAQGEETQPRKAGISSHPRYTQRYKYQG